MPPARFKVRKKRSRKAEALERLRRLWEQNHPDETWSPESQPLIAPMLASIDGGEKRAVSALRMHDDRDARCFLETLDSLSPTDRKHVPIEAVAFASGIGSLRLAEIMQTALYLYASMETKLLISSAMRKVTDSIIKAATDHVPITARNPLTGDDEVVGKSNGDIKAMELFGKMSGIVPVPKGAQIAIQNIFSEKDHDDSSPLPSWRSAEERLKEFQDITEPRRLPSPQTTPMSIGGHIDHLQEETVGFLRDN